MEFFIDFEYLAGRQNEIVVAKNVSDSFRFKSPYILIFDGFEKNVSIGQDGHIA